MSYGCTSHHQIFQLPHEWQDYFVFCNIYIKWVYCAEWLYFLPSSIWTSPQMTGLFYFFYICFFVGFLVLSILSGVYYSCGMGVLLIAIFLRVHIHSTLKETYEKLRMKFVRCYVSFFQIFYYLFCTSRRTLLFQSWSFVLPLVTTCTSRNHNLHFPWDKCFLFIPLVHSTSCHISMYCPQYAYCTSM
jgi:hypothetical protein